MKMLRDHTQTDGEKVVAFGRYKAWMFQEVPQGYLDWVVKERKQNPNASDDLVQLANYAVAKAGLKDAEMSAGGKPQGPKMVARAGRDPEEVAVVSPPDMEVRSWGSGSEASIPSTKQRISRGKNTHPIEESEVEAAMAADIPPEDLEEMTRLRTRLAVLQQKNRVAPTAAAPGGSKLP